MSKNTPHQPTDPTPYANSFEFVEWVEHYLDVDLSDAQKQILRAVAEHQRTLIIGANGFGKSYTVACLILAWLYTNKPSKALATSGTYGKLKRTLCRPIESLHRYAAREYGIPGSFKHRPPRISMDDVGDPEWFFEATRPRDAGELEGTHSEFLLSVVEEVDKEAVDGRVIDSMESLMTDERDRIIAIGNPPRDESNVAYKLMQDDAWHVLQFSSFESHNIQRGLARDDAGYIDGLVTIGQVKDDWDSWNTAPWPGTDAAQVAHTDDDMRARLDERWYRRRIGIVPPATAQVYRPFTLGTAKQACLSDTKAADALAMEPSKPHGVGIDVARRGGDWNVLAARYDDHIHVHERWQGVDHTGNMGLIRRYLRKWKNPPTAVDAQGEGSGLADMLRQEFDIIRFNAGAKASQQTRFYDKWAEGLYHLGQFMQDGGSVGGEGPLYDELTAAARSLELHEQHYDSRNATVLKCSSKDDVKEQLGRSPDVLDAVYMANHAGGPRAGDRRGTQLTW